MLEIGLHHESQVRVTEQNTALTLGSGDMEVFAISVITDLGVEGIVEKCSHEEVQKAANAAQPLMTRIMQELVTEC